MNAMINDSNIWKRELLSRPRHFYLCQPYTISWTEKSSMGFNERGALSVGFNALTQWKVDDNEWRIATTCVRLPPSENWLICNRAFGHYWENTTEFYYLTEMEGGGGGGESQFTISNHPNTRTIRPKEICNHQMKTINQKYELDFVSIRM